MLQSNLPSSRSSESSVGGKAPNMEAQIQQFFERHTKDRSRQDYRFWLVSLACPVPAQYEHFRWRT